MFDTCHADQRSERPPAHLCPAKLWQARMEIPSIWPIQEGAGGSADKQQQTGTTELVSDHSFPNG